MSNFSRNHFHDTDVRELINKYKQYECLWNYNSIDYKNQPLRLRAWREIASYFNKDINEVKRKIKYLRSGYVAEKRKVDLSRKSGSESIYKPLLFYYEDLNFLDNIVVLRKGPNNSSNLSTDFETSNISTYTEDNEDFGTFANEEEEVDLKQPKLQFKVEALAEPEMELPLSPKIRSTPKISCSSSLNPRPAKRKINKEMKHGNSLSGNVSSDPAKKLQCRNLYSSFGKTIALHLQQMRLEDAVLAMSDINAIITKKTLEHIKSLQSKESCTSSDTEDSFNGMFADELDNSG